MYYLVVRGCPTFKHLIRERGIQKELASERGPKCSANTYFRTEMSEGREGMEVRDGRKRERERERESEAMEREIAGRKCRADKYLLTCF